jgi:hypothetical protein
VKGLKTFFFKYRKSIVHNAPETAWLHETGDRKEKSFFFFFFFLNREFTVHSAPGAAWPYKKGGP